MSGPSYLREGDLSGDLRAKLATLGAESPEHLREMLRLARPPLERLLGRAGLEEVERWLESFRPQGLPADRRAEDREWRPPPPGVPLRSAPRGPGPPRVDIARRDALFEELQRLRRTNAPAGRIRAVEEELDRLLAAG